MPRYAYMLRLRDDPQAIAEYREHHRRVWDEVVEALKAVGIQRMDIYLLGRTLVMTMEVGDDFDLEGWGAAYLAHHPQCREWDALMRTYQEPVPEAQPGEWWARMEPVFQL